MSPPQPLPPKKEVALALLERSSVYIHLDPRQAAAIVPAGFKKQPQLVLQVGLNMHVPIPDLRVDETGISCTLSFNRTPFFCVVPWPSVFAMVGEDGRGMVWPDDVPAEVARQAQGRTDATTPTRKEPPKPAIAAAGPPPPREVKADGPPKAKRPRKRPALAAVPDGGEAPRAASKAGAVERAPTPVPRPATPTAPRQTAGSLGSARKKRELPPYLRVVK